jgi:hypothetical protein
MLKNAYKWSCGFDLRRWKLERNAVIELDDKSFKTRE